MGFSYKSILAFCSSVVLISLAAQTGVPLIYFIASGIVGLSLGLFGLRNLHTVCASQSTSSSLSAAAAQHMGLVWAWGCLALFITYSFFIPPWREWVFFSACFGIVAAVSLIFATAMENDAKKGKEDPSLLKIGRLLTIIQLCGTIAAMLGLLIDPQKFFLNIDKRDWAANNIFFFGSLGLTIISATALFYSQKRKN